MRHLCDSNVLVALVLASHPHHGLARNWFNAMPAEDTAVLCRLTQLSFLRLLTTEAILKHDVQTNAKAQDIWRKLAGHPRCEFVLDEPAGQDARWSELSGSTKASPKVWMDAYLASFAMGHFMRLVTFDRGFTAYRKQGLDLILLAPRA